MTTKVERTDSDTKVERTDSDVKVERAGSDWRQVGFYNIAVVFNLCLVAQVLSVGVAYFSDPSWWTIHVWLVRGYSGLSLVLLGGALTLPFSKRIRSLAASMPVLLLFQFCSIHLHTPLHLQILHPLIGFTLFYFSSSLVHHIWREMRDGSPSESIAS
ncbi:MAG: DUF6220 domain-containing protein [Cyanobacteria bacterium J06597_1]